MESWETALKKTMDLVHGPLEREFRGEWCLIGSAATALQGIDVAPRDLDMLARRPEIVFRFAELMADFAPDTNPYPDDMERWLSSAEKPVKVDEPNLEEFVWHFGRWVVDGFEVEVAHIVPPAGMRFDDGMWEAGPKIWNHVKHAKLGNWDIPVVPLEIQLQTNLGRKLDSRVENIVRRFRENGHDRELLGSALSEANRKRLEELL
jgi:hypothetical protein